MRLSSVIKRVGAGFSLKEAENIKGMRHLTPEGVLTRELPDRFVEVESKV
jgi:hypothetical protein